MGQVLDSWVFSTDGIIWKTFFEFCFGLMVSVDAPICVVKRFRKADQQALTTPPCAESRFELSAGSFELVSGSVHDTEVASCQDPDEFSLISPIDLFAAQSEPDTQFQNRWTQFGDYDFNYQPGGASDPLATAGRRLTCFGTSGTTAWQPPQKRPKQFDTPVFWNSAQSWQLPPMVRKSRASLELNTHQVAQSHRISSPMVESLRVMCPDMPVVRTPLSSTSFQGPSNSMQQAWTAAKVELNKQWLDLLQDMGSFSGLEATVSSKNMDEHRLRVISKFAPSTLQSYFRIWTRWHDFARQLAASPFQPDSAFLADFLAEHAHGPLQVATAYHKGLTWVARHAQLPELFQALQTSVCKAYLQSSIIREKRESAPLPLSFVVFLEKMVLSKTTSAGDVLQLGGLLFLIWSSLRWSDALWVDPHSMTIQQHALFAMASHTKTTNRGMPIACFAFGLMGHHGNASWAQLWMNVIQQAMHDTEQLYPSYAVDFLLTEVGPDMQKPLFLRPMPRDRGLQLLRYWMCKCHESFQV